ncbi:MAG: hypothetical protein KUG77_19215 [Nannocystaceae bacterium]|nr:hypothetical protein [Nannocystaceae bacterium]
MVARLRASGGIRQWYERRALVRCTAGNRDYDNPRSVAPAGSRAFPLVRVPEHHAAHLVEVGEAYGNPDTTDTPTPPLSPSAGRAL